MIALTYVQTQILGLIIFALYCAVMLWVVWTPKNPKTTIRQAVEEIFAPAPHVHEPARGGFLDHVPLNEPPDIRHTAFWLTICSCGAWECQPRENRKLVTPEAIAALARELELDVNKEVTDVMNEVLF